MNSFESLCEVGAALRVEVSGINAGFCLSLLRRGKLWTATPVNPLVSPVKYSRNL